MVRDLVMILFMGVAAFGVGTIAALITWGLAVLY